MDIRTVKKIAEEVDKEISKNEEAKLTCSYFTIPFLYASKYEEFKELIREDKIETDEWINFQYFKERFWVPLTTINPDATVNSYAGNISLDAERFCLLYNKVKEKVGIPHLIPEEKLPKTGKDNLKHLIVKLVLISFLDEKEIKEIFKANGIKDPERYLWDARAYASKKEAIQDYEYVGHCIDTAFFILLEKLGENPEVPSCVAQAFFGYPYSLTVYTDREGSSYKTFIPEIVKLSDKRKELIGKFLDTFLNKSHVPYTIVSRIPSDKFYDLKRTEKAIKSVKENVKDYKGMLRLNDYNILALGKHKFDSSTPLKVYTAIRLDRNYYFLLNGLKKMINVFDSDSQFDKKLRKIIKNLIKELEEKPKITPAKRKKKIRMIV